MFSHISIYISILSQLLQNCISLTDPCAKARFSPTCVTMKPRCRWEGELLDQLASKAKKERGKRAKKHKPPLSQLDLSLVTFLSMHTNQGWHHSHGSCQRGEREGSSRRREAAAAIWISIWISWSRLPPQARRQEEVLDDPQSVSAHQTLPCPLIHLCVLCDCVASYNLLRNPLMISWTCVITLPSPPKHLCCEWNCWTAYSFAILPCPPHHLFFELLSVVKVNLCSAV